MDLLAFSSWGMLGSEAEDTPIPEDSKVYILEVGIGLEFEDIAVNLEVYDTQDTVSVETESIETVVAADTEAILIDGLVMEETSVIDSIDIEDQVSIADDSLNITESIPLEVTIDME